MNENTDLYGNPLPKRCPACNKFIEDPYGRQTYCSIECRERAKKQRNLVKADPGALHTFPSASEQEIIDDNSLVFQPGSRYSSYGQYEAARRAKADGKIHAPAGFTSYYERERRRANTNEKNQTA